MQSINLQIILGNLLCDAETKSLPNGGRVTQVRVATNESWKDKTTGEYKERTERHTAKCFGKLAERLADLKKGMRVYIEGTTRTEEYEDASKIKRYSKVVMIDDFKPLCDSSPRPTSQRDERPAAPAEQVRQKPSAQTPPASNNEPLPKRYGRDPNPFVDDPNGDERPF